MAKAPFVLLVNPWITDFAAFDLWAKPLGLLRLAALLRDGGCGVAFIDCLDRFDTTGADRDRHRLGRSRLFGTGKFAKTVTAKPPAYRDLARPYYRYGIPPEALRRRLQELPVPDLIWVTAIMTYWYPGLVQTIAEIRQVFPGTPIWLGGIYAQLCAAHALAHSGADWVFTGPLALLPDRVEAATGFRLRNRPAWSDFASAPPPAWDLVEHLPYVPLLTSLGCPYRCPYCASQRLQPRVEKRPAAALLDEVRYWHQAFGVEDFAFYDDALLLSGAGPVRSLLEHVAAEGPRVRFHTPNALHVRALTEDWCDLLYRSGFTTVRLGLETSRPEHQRAWGGKVESRMFLQAVERLRAAGFDLGQVGVYLLAGVPGQEPEEVAEAIAFVRRTGAQPHLAEYSPIPGTPMGEIAARQADYDLAGEPLYHNNSFFACRRPDFTLADLARLKRLAREARRRPDSAAAAPTEGNAIDFRCAATKAACRARRESSKCRAPGEPSALGRKDDLL